MDSEESKNAKGQTSQYITDLAFEQIKRLDSALDAIDAKAGVLLGFTALLIVFTLESWAPDRSSPADLFFTYSGTFALLASIVANIIGIVPRGVRYDPKIKTLAEKYWDEELPELLRRVSGNLAEVWEFNGNLLDRKSKWLCLSLWLVLAGLVSLAIDVLVVRL